MSEKKYNFSSFRILVVDDNTNMRKIIRGLLNNFGVRDVVEVEDETGITEELNNNNFDIIFMDWVLGNQTAHEIIKNVRLNSNHPYVPIIVISGYASKQVVITARDAGVTEFIAKPVSASTMFGRLASIIDHQRSFIETQEYFGPDRRRKNDIKFDSAERRKTSNAGGEGMSQEDIDSLMRF
jgi:two-component system, chemotaxis family, chemotaxis protein CheY